MAMSRNCLKNPPTASTGRRAIVSSLVFAIAIGAACADDKLLEKSLPPAYNLGQWLIGPVALGLLLCVTVLGLGFARRRSEAPLPLTNSAGATHMRYLLLTLLSFYLICILLGLVCEFGAGSSTPSAVVANQDAEKNAAIESVFGRFRTPLREGSIKAFLSVAAIVCTMNTIGAVTMHFIPGVLLIPGVALLGYTGWHQGTEFATCGASTFGSMLGFLWTGGLEFFTYVLGTAAGANVALAILFPSWLGVNTRKAALRASLVTALKFFGVILAILIFQALCETLYVRQVLLHGGSGVPLMPY